MGTRQAFSTAFHPQTDGQTERMNRVIEDMIRHYVGPYHDDWDKSLALVEFAINNSYQESIQNTPFRAYLGYDPTTPLKAEVESKCPAANNWWADHIERQEQCKACMQAAQDRQKAHYDKRRTEVFFNLGDKVLLSTRNMKFKATGKPKFTPRFVGPYTITECIGPRDEVTGVVKQVTACRLALPKMMRIHPVFHVGLIKHWRSDGVVHVGQPLEFDSDGAPVWNIQCIMREKSRVIGTSSKRRLEYLVRWQDFGIEQDTWELAKAVKKSAPHVVDAWRSRVTPVVPRRTSKKRAHHQPIALDAYDTAVIRLLYL
jgi:hypothetical protein